MWDFENDTVMTNMTLWASWEEACFVSFDLNDGTSTEYYNATVPVGGKITHKPADPTRDGYLFKGWYSYLDQNNEPVMWDFESDTVMTNMSLWASWEKENSSDNINGGNSENGNNGSGENSENGNNDSGGSSGSINSKNGPVVTGRVDDKGIVNINEQEVPKVEAPKVEAPIFPVNSENVNIDEQAVPKGSLDNLPKTGEDNTSRVLYSALVLVSLFMIGTCLLYKKKNI